MDVLMDCFFEQIFSGLDRGYLIARYKRRQLVDYFSTIIQGCCKGEDNCDSESGCRRAVCAALKFHERTCEGNSKVCLLGKYHNILYVASKLAFDWKLQDNETVIWLLKDIYKCEKTFERLFVGAIFGTRVTHLISGWKSDFQNREENCQALKYFIEHATKANLTFSVNGLQRKFIDIPMESYGNATALRVAVQAGQSDILPLLLHYGATITFYPANVQTCALQPLLHRMNRLFYQNPEKDIPQEFVKCLNILLRELPSLPPLLDDFFDPEPETLEMHPNIFSVIPPEKAGIKAPDLKDLCRCVIRDCLRKCGQLPYGIEELQIPVPLKKFLDFIDD